MVSRDAKALRSGRDLAQLARLGRNDSDANSVAQRGLAGTPAGVPELDFRQCK
jgi:hypothetical protein